MFRASYVYDNLGNLRWTIDPLGTETFYRYDALNRVTGIFSTPAGTPLTVADRQDILSDAFTPDQRSDANPDTTIPATTIAYTPTAYGWRETVTDPHGNATVTQRDFLGRVQYVVQPSVVKGLYLRSPVTWYDYFADGLLQSVTDAEFHATAYRYDGRGRLSATLEPTCRRIGP
jgi:YD repeat-containing protein